MSISSRNRVFLWLFLSLIFTALVRADTYESQEDVWRHKRCDKLSASDGWLSLIGLHWLSLGKNTVGASSDNSIQLSAGPAHFGLITWSKDNSLVFEPSNETTVTIDKEVIKKSISISTNEEKPSLIQNGSVSFFIIKRGDKIGLRVKDSISKRRLDFKGLDYYPINKAWRINAKWVNFNPEHHINITNVLGQTSLEPVPGKAVINYSGKTYELIPITEGKDEPLFFIIRDKTSGLDTYGASRFLYADWPKNGIITLDFNRSENPPCAFTPYATCPLPPKENCLPFAITAGEKKYQGEEN